MSKFAVGDIVYLNSGSPPMTVMDLAKGNFEGTDFINYWCEWIKPDGAVEGNNFDEKCIRKEMNVNWGKV